MGKSSSSMKKKHSRNRSKSHSMKKRKSSKSHRDKSKKLRRRHDSVSFSDDSDSRSLVSVTPSDSENEYVSRKSRSRSRTRKDVKRSKKRSRKQSLSSDNSSPSPVRRKKVSRSSRRDDKHGRRKKDRPKKKSRRDVSVSSVSSGSESSSESDEGEFERRGKSERDKKHEIKLEEVITEGRSRDDSIASSHGRYSEYSEFQSEEEIVVEQNTSRRLKSVVTVVEVENEERELEGYEHKEEIISDHNDYPSSKSNDSNDGLIRKEFFQHLGIASETRNRDDDKEETNVSNVRTSSIISGNNGTASSDLVGKNDNEEKRKSEASGSAGNVGGEDLETTLRQQALENLRKFRGGSQTNVKSPTTVLSKEETNSVELKSTREDGSNVIIASQASQQRRLPATQNDSSGSPHDGKITEASDGGDKGSQIAELDVASAENNISSAEKNSESIKQRGSSRESLNISTNLKQGLLPKEHSQTVLVPRSKRKESAAEPAQSAEPKSDNDDGKKIKDVHDSTRDEPSGPGSRSADVEESSDFEQRTMTVMRGGELVQVSYKVKIPKRTPALARRQLKR